MSPSFRLRFELLEVPDSVASPEVGRVLRVELHGERSLDNILQATSEILARGARVGASRFLLVTEWQGSLGHDAALSAGQRVAELGVNPRQKWALVPVDPQRLEEARMTVEGAPSHAVRARIFLSEDEALVWLRAS